MTTGETLIAGHYSFCTELGIRLLNLPYPEMATEKTQVLNKASMIIYLIMCI